MDDAKATPAAGIKAAELFVRCLEAEGVELIFGLPGEIGRASCRERVSSPV